MSPERCQQITGQYSRLRIAVLGDFCLDRYLEIDPAKQETSIETGLPVHNVINVRPQPGGAGTILNNLSALGVGTIYPIGFAGFDGEGFELWTALEKRSGVDMQCFVRTDRRRTFTYCKPLLLETGKAPLELNRLDSKNWTPTPAPVEELLMNSVRRVAGFADALIVLDQVSLPNTGAVTQNVLAAVGQLARANPDLFILADSRCGLQGYPPVVFKMNGSELSALMGSAVLLGFDQIKEQARALAHNNQRRVFVTLAEKGLMGACPNGEVQHVAALPLRGEIDIVGAGDAVSANLTAAIAAGANVREALELANAAASVVIHKLGTTGTASTDEITRLLLERAG